MASRLRRNIGRMPMTKFHVKLTTNCLTIILLLAFHESEKKKSSGRSKFSCARLRTRFTDRADRWSLKKISRVALRSSPSRTWSLG